MTDKQTWQQLVSKEQRPIEWLIIAGVCFAQVENWEIVDDVIVSTFKEKFPSLSADSLVCCYQLPEAFLKHKHPNIRDYGATLATTFFKLSEYNESCHGGLIAVLKEVAYTDEALWPRFRASIALLQADKNKAKGEHIDLQPSKLRENLMQALKKDLSLYDITIPYIDHIDYELPP